MKYISIIGSTGSIGTQTLDIVRSNKDLKVTALAAGTSIDLLEKQAREFQPVIVAVYNEQKAEELKLRLADTNIKVCAGMDGLLEAATQEQCSVVVTAIVGMIGIRPTIAAMKAGKDIALANKETLVTAGHIIMPMAEELGVSIYPVDSEHSAIFQCLQSGKRDDLDSLIITASGGPFRKKTTEELKYVRRYDYVVAKDGSGDFFTVQEAVNAAVGGGKKTISILVRPGVYEEYVSMPESSPRIELVKQTGAEIRDNGFTQDVYVAPYKGDRVCAISYHLIRTG